MLVEGSEFQYEIGKELVESQAYIQKDRFEYSWRHIQIERHRHEMNGQL